MIGRKSKADRFKTAPEIRLGMYIQYGDHSSFSTAEGSLSEREKPRLFSRQKKARTNTGIKGSDRE